ncbi:MAG: HlyD family efflux transporter periplasmic adaptor subunit [Balneolaceae bacterium]|nr:HlyD family efflux transporter periplasmic adaptor subunit [Balneolaceae bacterium]
MNKEKRKILILTAAILVAIFVIGGIILMQFSGTEEGFTDRAEPVAAASHQPEIITVQTSHQKNQIEIQGRVRAENRLELFPEVQAKVLPGKKPFREGIAFDKGETLLQLDDEEARLQLYASRSQFQTLAASLLPDIRLDYPDLLNRYEEWYNSLHPESTLPEIPNFEHRRMERFLTSRGVYNSYYQIKSAENRLEKFTIRAPFSGILSVAKVEPGQSVGPQVHVGTLVDPKSYQLTATVRQSQIRFVGIGDIVELTDNHKSGSWTASVTRLNPSVDVRSQTVEIYLDVGGNGIREGMYLEGLLESGEPVEIAEIPKSALLRNGFVYAVMDGVTRQVPVQVTDVGHETVWVTGLTDGDQIIRDAGVAISGQLIGERTP